MATIRISDLTADTTPSASDLIPVDGATTRKTTLAQAVAAARPLADQAEAEAGTDAAKAMTPLTTKQAIVAIGGANFATAAQGATADTAVQPGDLSTVATSGDYDDLSNKPTLSTVATSGDYDDLSNKPTLGSAAAEDTSAFATAAQGVLADAAVQPADLAAVQVPTGGTTGQVLAKSSDTDNDVEWTTANAGDVLGPSSVADSELAAFDSTTGKLLKKSTVQLSEIARATPTPPTFAYRFKEGQPLPNAFSFARDGVALTQARNALLSSVSANSIRHSYSVDGAYRGVLINQALENRLTYSDDLTNAAWNTARIDFGAAIQSPLAGDTTSAVKLIPTTSSGAHYIYQELSYTSGDNVCRGFFAKAGEYDKFRAYFTSSAFTAGDDQITVNLTAGTITSEGADIVDSNIWPLADNWYFISVSAAAAATDTGYLMIRIQDEGGNETYAGDGTKGLYFWRMVEVLDRIEIAPEEAVGTTASAVTRPADALTADIDDIGLNANEGTFFWRGSLDALGSARQGLLFAREGSTAGVSLYFNSDGNYFTMMKRDGGGYTVAEFAYGPSLGEEVSVAAYWTEAEIGISVNGGAAVTAAATEAPTPTALWIGKGTGIGSGADNLAQNGTTREFAVWDRALPSEITVLAARGPAIGETLYAPEVLKKRYIDVGSSEWGTPSDDSKDAHAAIQNAFNAGNGREIVFTNPYGGKRAYRSLTRPSGAGLISGALIMPKQARIIMEPGAVLDFSNWATSGNPKYFLYANGGTYAVEPTSYALSGNAASGDTSITLSSGGSNFTRGWHVILSNADFTTEDGSLGKKGEWIYVQSVSSNTLTLGAKLRDSYATADSARAIPMNDICELTLEGINITGPGRFAADTAGDRGIGIDTGFNCKVLGGSIQGSDNLSVSLTNILNGEINGVRIAFGPKVSDAVNQYGPHLTNLCENVKVVNCDIMGGKEGLGLSMTGGILGATRDCTFAHNRVRGAWRGGFTTHDTHENIIVHDNIFHDCELGIDNRIIGGTYVNNVFKRLGFGGGTLSAALLLGSGAQKVLFQGNTIEGATYAVRLPAATSHEVAPGDIDIIDNDARQLSSYGVLIENTAASTAACGTVTVSGNRFEGDGSTAMRGVEIEGKWKPIVVNNYYRNGNANRCIYLHATDNGEGSNGPVNPVVTGNRWDSSFIAPLISHHSGRMTVFDNYNFAATALPSVASASAISLPVDGDTFNITGTTTINTIANAASYVGRRVTLIFGGSLTVTHNANAGSANDIQLAGGANFAATLADTLTLVSNGLTWREISRAAI